MDQDVEIIRYMGGGLTFDYYDNLPYPDALHIRYHVLNRIQAEIDKANNEEGSI